MIDDRHTMPVAGRLLRSEVYDTVPSATELHSRRIDKKGSPNLRVRAASKQTMY